MPISLAAVVGLIIGLLHFLVSRPGERPGLDFVLLTGIAEFWLAAILAGALILAGVACIAAAIDGRRA